MNKYQWKRLQAEIAETCGEEHDRLARLENDILDSEEQKSWEKPDKGGDTNGDKFRKIT